METSARMPGGISQKGTLTDAQADEVVAAMQAGVTPMVTRPSSPNGKRKQGGGAGRHPPDSNGQTII